MGCATWPDEPIYGKCAVCGEEAKRCSNVQPMDPEEARSAKLHYEFGRYCEKRVLEPLDTLPDELDALLAESRALRERT